MTGVEIALAAVAVVGSAVAAAGAIQQGNAAKKAAKANAEAAEREAKFARERALFEEEKLRRSNRRFQSRQRAAIGASGVTLAGSPLLLLSESAADAELEALSVRFGGSVEEARAKTQASQDRFAGRQAKRASRFGAASSLLTGAGRALGQFN